MLRNTLIKACVQADTHLGPLMTPAHSLYKNNKGIRFDPTCKFLLMDIKLQVLWYVGVLFLDFSDN